MLQSVSFIIDDEDSFKLLIVDEIYSYYIYWFIQSSLYHRNYIYMYIYKGVWVCMWGLWVFYVYVSEYFNAVNIYI